MVVAAEKRGKAIGRIRLRYIKDASAESLLQFIRDVVEPGTTIYTDGWKGYKHKSDAFVQGLVTDLRCMTRAISWLR